MNQVQNSKSKNKVNITTKDLVILLIFALIYLGLFFSDTIIDYTNNTGDQLTESRKISKLMADLSVEIDKINIDTSILNNQFLRSVTSLPTYPLDVNLLNFGKNNPFTGSNIVVATSSAGVVGGVRYTSQTSTTTGSVITTPIATSTAR